MGQQKQNHYDERKILKMRKNAENLRSNFKQNTFLPRTNGIAWKSKGGKLKMQ